MEEAVSRALPMLKGAFSPDCHVPPEAGGRPGTLGLPAPVYGRKGDAILFASESCALDGVEAEYIREVEPGEIVVVEDGKMRSIRDNCRGMSHMCIFEYIYFARPRQRHLWPVRP